jgi:pSer/pThr/pTyr-binding forkhead associated (FHA) protein
MASLEVFDRFNRLVGRVELETERCTIGRSEDCDVVISEDGSVSRAHAVLERIGSIRWTVRDLGAANGTFVNGDRLFTDRVLRDGDELLLGRTRLAYCNAADRKHPATEGLAPPPSLTRTELQVLMELVRPILSGSVFTEAASVEEIAERLVVTQQAVKNHLGSMYIKFEVPEQPKRPARRSRLAEEALARGAVNLADLRGRDQ